MSKKRKPIRIVHLSDLHLGNDAILRAVKNRRNWRIPPNDSLRIRLANTLKLLSPDILVISGDLVNKPSRKSFRLAHEYIDQLCIDSHLSGKDRLLIVPGNHDVSLWFKQEEELKRLRRYNNCLRKIYGNHTANRRIVHLPRFKTIFALFDSTLKTAHPVAEGEIGKEQLQWFSREMDILEQSLDTKTYVKVAVLHHHCVSLADTSIGSARFMALLDEADFINTLGRYGFNLVLHGHRHVPHFTPLYREDSVTVTVIGAGSTACTLPDETGDDGNSFNLVEVEPEKNLIQCSTYGTSGKKDFELVKSSIKTFYLDPPASAGYSIETLRKVTTLGADGINRIASQKENVRVEKPGMEIEVMPYRMETELGAFFDLVSEEADVAIESANHTSRLMVGQFRLPHPISYGGPSVTLTHRYSIRTDLPIDIEGMRAKERTQETEFTAMRISHPVKIAIIDVLFPWRYPIDAIVEVQVMGRAIPLNQLDIEEHTDHLAGRFSVTIVNPPLQAYIKVRWRLPQKYPLEIDRQIKLPYA